MTQGEAHQPCHGPHPAGTNLPEPDPDVRTDPIHRTGSRPRVPEAPGALPLLGHALRLVRDPLPWLRDCGRRRAPVLRLRLGRRPAYLVCHPHLVHDMLVARANEFDKGGPIIDRARELVGNGLATSPHAEHRAQRRLIQPAFSAACVASYTTILQEESAHLAASWRPHTEVGLLPDLTTAVTKILSRALLPTLDPAEAEELLPDLQRVMGGVLIRAALPFNWMLRLPTPANRRFTRSRTAVWTAADRWVASARALPQQGGVLSQLISADTHDPAHALTDTGLRDQVVTLLIAGTETTASTVAWLFHLLTLHPHAEERLHQELDTVLGGALATSDSYDRLPVTRAVLLETMRLYPTVPLISRISTRPVTLAAHTFPAGTDFFFSSYQLQHDPSAFPHPERFDPDRWTSPTQPTAHQGYIPFSTGKRKCIGDNLALAEATTLISAIAQQWRLRPTNGIQPRPHMRTTLSPGNLRLTAEPRHPRPQG